MPLDELLETIETLSRLMDRHGAAMRESQALTRYSLVDPMLRRLGWDTEDPDIVIPEYRVGAGAHDYGLLDGGRLVALIEAEALDEPLADRLPQALATARAAGAAHYAITNGRRWLVYPTSETDSGLPRPAAQFSLDDPAAETCVNALALWRPLLTTRRESRPSAFTEPPPSEWDTGQPQESATDWVSLTRLDAALGDTPPAELRFPSGERIETGTWIALPVEAARWLVRQGNLNSNTPPVQAGSRFILASQPRHPTGTPFAQIKEAGPLYLEAKYDATYCSRNAQLIIQHAGLDPVDFSVRLAG